MKLMEGSRPIRLCAVALAVALMGVACGGQPAVFEDGAQKRSAGAGFEELKLPEPVPAVPAFVVTSTKLRSSDVDAIEKIDGTAIAVPASVRNVKVSAGKKSSNLKVAAVEPVDFRSVAPAATKSADFVWLALLGGDAVVTQDAADELKLDGATSLKVKGIGGVTIGALADNGTPNIADVLVSDEVADTKTPTHVVVGAESGVTLNTLARQIRSKVRGAELTWLLPKSEKVAVVQVATGTSVSMPSVAGLHPALSQAVNQLIAAGNGRIWIVSGYRSSERQYELWIEALKKYGSPEAADNWVAPPGHSNHERGLAVDLGGDLELAARLVQELNLPMWRPMSWEPWHFELSGSRG